MKKHLLGALAISVLVMTACAQSKKMKSQGTSSASAVKTPAVHYVSMERTACFGQCPTYKIEMFEDGRVVYEGRMFAKPQGTYEKNIGAEKVKAIFDKFEYYRADTCKKEYEMLISDLPGLTYEIKLDNETKQINNAHFGPGFLKELANKIDQNVKPDDSWKKTADFKNE